MFKKLLGFGTVTILAIIVLTVSCQREQASLSSTTAPVDNVGAPKIAWPRIYARFRWEWVIQPGQPNPCAGPDCGYCVGACVRVEPRGTMSPLTEQQIANHYNYVDMTVSPDGTKMTFNPSESMDNGDGKTRIVYEWDMGSEVSALLGYQSVKVKVGTYAIDFSNPTSYPFGRATFDVISIK